MESDEKINMGLRGKMRFRFEGSSILLFWKRFTSKGSGVKFIFSVLRYELFISDET